MSDNTPAVAPAGWYPDSTHPGHLRYWSGAAWTEYFHPPLAPSAPPPAPVQAAEVQPAVVPPAVVPAAVVPPVETQATQVLPAAYASPTEAPVGTPAPAAAVGPRKRRRWILPVSIVGGLLVIALIASIAGIASRGSAGSAAAAGATSAPTAGTAGPTPTKSAGATPGATPGSSSAATAKPTPAPTATSVPQPAKPTVPTQKLAGSGDDVQDIDLKGLPAIITFDCPSCSSNTVLQTDGADSLLVNQIGAWHGAYLVDAQSGSVTSELTVMATGDWTITVEDLSTIAPSPDLVSWHGDTVLRYDAKFTKATITNSGEGNFVVMDYAGDYPDLVINEVGDYSGTVKLAAPGYVQVLSSGEWSITHK